MKTSPMAPKVMSISDARRLLPGLIREAASRGPITIGSRGRAAAVLLGVEEFGQLKALAARGDGTESPWARLRLQPVGTLEGIAAELVTLRRERTFALVGLDGAPTRKPRPKAPRAEESKSRRPAARANGRPAR
jgi:prevent-host-death family protein